MEKNGVLNKCIALVSSSKDYNDNDEPLDESDLLLMEEAISKELRGEV